LAERLTQETAAKDEADAEPKPEETPAGELFEQEVQA